MARKMAGVRQRANGIFEKRFTVDGKRYSVYGNSARECMENELKRRQEIADHTYTKNSRLILDKYFEEWIEEKAQSTKANTVCVYRALYRNYISPCMGKRKIRDIERREVLKIQADMHKTLARNTVNKTISILSEILKSAVLNDIIARNVCEGIKGVKIKETEKEARSTIHRALTEQEIATFMKYAGQSWYYNAFRLLLATGMRAGECCALYWTDIDYAKGVIHITKTITRDEAGKFVVGNSPKTKSSKRDIPMNPQILNILRAQRDRYTALHGSKVQYLNARVFETDMGKRSTPSAIADAVRKVLRRAAKAGEPIKPFTPHAFRDTFASMAAMQKMPMNTLKEIMGHSSYAMTCDLYCHGYEEQKQSEMQAIQIASV